jgi:FkbM family methyltransferase
VLRALVYPALRNAYQQAFNRTWWRRRQELRDLFRPYIESGDLVFDIGANRGHYAEVFHELGGRVVAVEPNPALVQQIRRNYGRRLLDVVCAAVGERKGEAEFHLAGDDQHSTLSERWQALSPEADWRGTVTVPVVTVDMLIDEYGAPGFVKIDVEGHEPQVLRGLSYPVPALCFEWIAAMPEGYEASVRRLAELGMYELTERTTGESGDVFARLLSG